MLEFGIGFGFGIISLLATLLICNYIKLPQTWAFLGLIAGVIGFLVTPLVPDSVRWISLTFQGTIPAMFWLNCRLFFADKMHWNQGVWILALYGVVASTFARHMEIDSASILFFFWELPILIEYILLVFAFGTIVANWSQDLVESRRLMRGWVMAIAGIAIVFGEFSIRLGVGSKLTLIWIANLGMFFIAVLVLVARRGAATFDNRPLNPSAGLGKEDHLVVENESDASAERDSGESEAKDDIPEHDRWMLNRLNELMAGGYYRNDGLTIKKLAEEVDLPEYKTRQVINQYLGYRNFNDYIHQLRIAEAAARLVTEPNAPILNISLDVGYRTLSSFNRAFKDIQGVSPTEYRKQPR